jgi:two-component system chemotaxis response regulator CheB
MIRLLIVDDQLAVREVLADKLGADPEIEVVGKAKDGLEAQFLIHSLKPDVLTLDVHMPLMGGIELLRWMRTNVSVPTIMLSSYTDEGTRATLEALSAGAFDFVHKPDGSESDFQRMLAELTTKIHLAHNSAQTNKLPKSERTLRRERFLSETKDDEYIGRPLQKKRKYQFVALGSSTGGTQAIETILRDLPENFPGIVIVQHMPAHFTKLFADRLNMEVAMEVREAQDRDEIRDGLVLIAPGDRHLIIEKNFQSTGFHVRIQDGERVAGHRPSVTHMFESASRTGFAHKIVGVILTGMGKDGAVGMEKMKAMGSYNIGQDESTSVVFGMPREAYEIGAVDELLPLQKIGSRLIELCMY